MKYKVYTNKIKLNVVNEYLVTKKLKMIEIKTEYRLSTRSLIYNWLKKYQKNNNKLTTSHAFKINHKKDKINIKDKNLKFENEKLKKSLLKEKNKKWIFKTKTILWSTIKKQSK